MLRFVEYIKCLNLPIHDNPFPVNPMLFTQLAFICSKLGEGMLRFGE